MSCNLHTTRVCKYRQEFVYFVFSARAPEQPEAFSGCQWKWSPLTPSTESAKCFRLLRSATGRLSIRIAKTTLARILLQKLRAPSSTLSRQRGRKYISKSRYKIRFIPSSRGDSMDREAPNCNASIQIYFDVHGECFPMTIADTFCHSIQFSTFAAECFLNANVPLSPFMPPTPLERLTSAQKSTEFTSRHRAQVFPLRFLCVGGPSLPSRFAIKCEKSVVLHSSFANLLELLNIYRSGRWRIALLNVISRRLLFCFVFPPPFSSFLLTSKRPPPAREIPSQNFRDSRTFRNYFDKTHYR